MGLGLKSRGPVVAWGRNSDGKCDVRAPNGIGVDSGYTSIANTVIVHIGTGVEVLTCHSGN